MPAKHRLLIAGEAADALRTLHPQTKRRVRAALEALSTEPTLGKELSDELEGFRSARVGRYRIVYQVSRGAIRVIDVGRHETIYEELARRLHHTASGDEES